MDEGSKYTTNNGEKGQSILPSIQLICDVEKENKLRRHIVSVSMEENIYDKVLEEILFTRYSTREKSCLCVAGQPLVRNLLMCLRYVKLAGRQEAKRTLLK